MAFDPSLVAFTAGIGGMPQERPEGGCAKRTGDLVRLLEDVAGDLYLRRPEPPAPDTIAGGGSKY